MTGGPWPGIGFELRVNGAACPVERAWIGENLLFVLRERLGLAGTKDGCAEGECGSCTVLLDGVPTNACLIPAAAAVDREIVTVERAYAASRDLQEALVEAGAVQCGFCTPGVLVSLHALLERNQDPSPGVIKETLSGNLCRCVSAQRFVNAVRATVRQREAAAGLPGQRRAPGESMR